MPLSHASKQRRYLEKLTATINELKAIVCPNADIPVYQVLGQTVALLTGTVYTIEELAHVKVRNWYRIKENEEWKKLEAWLIDKGLAELSDKLRKRGVLEKVIEYLKALPPPPAPARPANRSFYIENLIN